MTRSDNQPGVTTIHSAGCSLLNLIYFQLSGSPLICSAVQPQLEDTS